MLDGDKIEEFDHVDDKNNEEYVRVILDDVNEVLVTMYVKKYDFSKTSEVDRNDIDD